MTEADSDFFFGRTAETVEMIRALESVPPSLPVLIGNSGVGKSSLAQAGVLAALARQGWPEGAAHAGLWPQAFRHSRSWCVLRMRPGAEPVKALIEPFLRTWQFDPTDPLWARRRAQWTGDLLDGKLALRDLLDATEQRYHELGSPSRRPSSPTWTRARSFTCGPTSASAAASRTSSPLGSSIRACAHS